MDSGSFGTPTVNTRFKNSLVEGNVRDNFLAYRKWIRVIPCNERKTMSVIDPVRKADFIIKEKQIRELLSECEISSDFFQYFNQQVIQLLLKADTRRKYNKRKRLFPHDA